VTTTYTGEQKKSQVLAKNFGSLPLTPHPSPAPSNSPTVASTTVFTLLETIYNEFDQIARRRRVFKVETIGDCYIAVCGLCDPRKENHVVMTRFARDCLYKFAVLTTQLEVSLGPGTRTLVLTPQ
jgi:hypothetical protein